MKNRALLTVAAATFAALWLHERMARVDDVQERFEQDLQRRRDEELGIITLHDTIGRTAMLFKGIDPNTGGRF